MREMGREISGRSWHNTIPLAGPPTLERAQLPIGVCVAGVCTRQHASVNPCECPAQRPQNISPASILVHSPLPPRACALAKLEAPKDSGKDEARGGRCGGGGSAGAMRFTALESLCHL
jgi:hypothetical protein